MNAVLVRVGIDHAYGGWNAPVRADGRFVYVPIPERSPAFHAGLRRDYAEVLPPLARFAATVAPEFVRYTALPAGLPGTPMHLDPDFSHLTYGDVGHRRGKRLSTMTGGDVVVFYAGLRPVYPTPHKLIYALVGLYVVDEVVRATNVEPHRRHENAHTRKIDHGPTDIVVRARAGVSGRLTRAIEFGEYRDRAYRVRRDLIGIWGGLSVLDGYVQQSGVPPAFLDPPRFLEWFERQRPSLTASNHDTP